MAQPLHDRLGHAVDAAIRRHRGTAIRVADVRAVSGGSINDCFALDLTDGSRLFLKSNDAPPPRMFEREAEGLRALEAAGELDVPAVVAVSDAPAFLLLEHVESGPVGDDFFPRFGRALARMHRTESPDARFGFHTDNYLGTTSQPNSPTADWCAFFGEHRLGFQLELARAGGRADAHLDRIGRRLVERLEDILGDPPAATSLVHGDLWSGNFLCGPTGRPVLIDPATHYADRETDLAMTRLFGGFPRAFYDAYEAEWPLRDGWERRLQLYELYQVLNHLNLFGGGYYGQAVGLIEGLLR